MDMELNVDDFRNRVASMRAELRLHALKLTGNTDEAEDLTQETLLVALRNESRYQEQGKLEAWVYSIMNNQYINLLKSKCRTLYSRSGKDVGVQPEEADDAGSMIACLPERLRAELTLLLKGYRYKEISEILKQPIGTTKSRIAQARQKIKKILNTETKRVHDMLYRQSVSAHTTVL